MAVGTRLTDHNGIMFPIAPCIALSTYRHNNTHKKLNSVFQGAKNYQNDLIFTEFRVF